MRKLKLTIYNKLYTVSRFALDWAVKNRHWKTAGTIMGWRNRLAEPILAEIHSRFVKTLAPITIAETEKPAKTKRTKPQRKK